MSDKITLNFDRAWGAIGTGGNCDISRFAVICGLNGSGKTHLLNAINAAYVNVEYENEPCKNIALFDSKLISSAQVAQFSNKEFEKSVQEHISLARSLQNKYHEHYGLDEEAIRNKDSYILRDFTSDSVHIAESIIEKSLQNKVEIKAENAIHLINLSDLYSRKSISIDPLLAIRNYIKLKEMNLFAEFQATRLKKDRTFLTDDEFQERFGDDPLEDINRSIEFVDLPYFYKATANPDGYPISLELKRKSDGLVVPNDRLSDGEKKLLFFALSLYRSGGAQKLPDIVLFDEPDSGLHPSLSLKMIRILKERILPKVKAILITTHSPSTIASVDEMCIYEKILDRNDPIKISQNRALNILCSGVPNISIKATNEKQVFVESEVDRDIYTSIWKSFKFEMIEGIKEVNLNFIASNKGKNSGSCDSVRDLVKKLQSTNIDSVHGIIDYDLKNKPSARIHVLGKSEVYSIENLILDPLGVGVYLMMKYQREQYECFIPEEIMRMRIADFNSNDEKLCATVRTAVSDIVVKKMENSGISEEIESDVALPYEVAYSNGIKITADKRICLHRGHDLEELYLDIFPFLKGVAKKRNGELMRDLCESVYKNYPGLIRGSLIDTLDGIESSES